MKRFIETKECDFGYAILINIEHVARIDVANNGNAIFYGKHYGKQGLVTTLKFDVVRHLLKDLILLP
jgi:predicted glycosyltransferase